MDSRKGGSNGYLMFGWKKVYKGRSEARAFRFRSGGSGDRVFRINLTFMERA